MPRARQLKYGFFINEKLAELPPLCRIFFEGLWLLSDREGKLEDRPKKLKAQILPYDDADIDAYLDALQDASFLRRYEIDAASYIKILNFEEHQNPHQNEAESIIPEPVTQDSDASTGDKPDPSGENPPCMPVTCMLDIKKEKNIKKRKKGSTQQKQVEADFERVYKKYPLHKDKNRAWRAFKKINPTSELADKMIFAIEEQEIERQIKIKKNEFVPDRKYLARWLNEKCWTDEVIKEVAIKKENSNPHMLCRSCGEKILKTEAHGNYCKKCDWKRHPLPTIDELKEMAHA